MRTNGKLSQFFEVSNHPIFTVSDLTHTEESGYVSGRCQTEFGYNHNEKNLAKIDRIIIK
ncbi:hypothetical protein [Alkalicoccobacillus gibsonii]|jgi:hypothetical protein|uniref:Uncharacterized protein n=1 Tax=Alkalicoccobacillus gibsonii TaxID=79881 RepID=A0ABU9VGG2_9BACI|nr:hypothetical protein [Alkalicoccobacillus gibsonii]MBM0064205.1 hypothetical protein [Alkalicoccobacillus gibsonii]